MGFSRTFRVVPKNPMEWQQFLRQLDPDPGSIELTSLVDSQALSVMGRATNTDGPPGDIVASADGQILGRNGNSLEFLTKSPVLTLGTDVSGSATFTNLGSATLNVTIANNAVSNAKLRDSAALSVIGRDSNSSGDPGDIAASSDGEVLRRSGTTLAFGKVATAGISDDAVTDAILRDSAALSVIGRSANTSGNPGDIAAANDGEVLRRSGTAIGFGTIATAGIADDQVTNAKLANMSTSTFKGRITAGSGDPEDLSAANAATIISSVNVGGTWVFTNKVRSGSTGTPPLDAAAPNSMAFIGSKSSSCYIEAYDGTRSAFFGADAGGIEIGSFTNHQVNFRTNNTDRWTIDTSGNLVGVTAGIGLKVKEGSNARMGAATLVAGTVTVNNTSVTANTRIFLSRSTTGGTTGDLSYTISASTSFTINSSSATDTSTVNWLLIEPSP